MNPTPTPNPSCTPMPTPGPPGGCYEYPPCSGQIVCVDGPWEHVPPIPSISGWGLILCGLLLVIAAFRGLRS